uniref:RecD helicase /ATP-dependent exoDNAse n=1 Tax=Marseillevirus LCMAC102 TaxID=2506603 RepID=A0A481YSR0_9VIRU|nr:MAG: RecD helicase /ATP-dependent exoDNAse [Marseillevirus LCMAC102]
MEHSIFTALDNHENIILHGPGGTGKTTVLKKIASHAQDNNKIVCCTATTGVAAINLNVPEKKIAASTLHRWAGVGLAQGVVDKLYTKVYHDELARKRWLKTDVLIVDEISMLGADLIEKLDFIGRKIRNNQEVSFGGLQLVFSGDFLQLPPVKDKWAFQSFAWKEIIFVPFIFTEPKRYDNQDYFQLLLRIREGKHTIEDLKKLRNRVRSYEKLFSILDDTKTLDVIRPTILHSLRVDVDSHNEKELAKLPDKTHEFIADDTFSASNNNVKSDYYIRLLDEAIPKAIALKVGAQVMLKCNLDVKGGLVNGSRGVILKIMTEPEECVYVRFINGQEIRIAKHLWTIEDKDAVATRSQLPFILAYALTIHKCQGATLDYAICNLGPSVFADGQAYVALSRVRDIKGLFISEFYPDSIKTNQTALKYVLGLEKK